MITSSSNIANVIKPIGMLRIGFWPCCGGDICRIQEIPVRKKRKKKIGIYEVVDVDGKVMLLEAKEKRYIIGGKKGIWRTIRGRHYFFPDDKSGVIPTIKRGK